MKKWFYYDDYLIISLGKNKKNENRMINDFWKTEEH